MVDLAELQAMAYVAQIIGVAGTLTAAFIAVRGYLNANKRAEEAKHKELETRDRELETRQAQLFMQIYSSFFSNPIQKSRAEVASWSYRDYDDFQSKYSHGANPEAYTMHSTLSFFYEGLGVLVLRKLIDPSLVDDLISGPITSYWEKMRPYYLEYRIKNDWPQFGEYIEYLYNHIKPIAEKQKKTLKEFGINHARKLPTT